nr:Hypothetical protein SC2p2_01120 [Methylocystis sp. SC2]
MEWPAAPTGILARVFDGAKIAIGDGAVGQIEQRRMGLRRDDFVLLHRRLLWCAIGPSRSGPAYLRNSIAKIQRTSISALA